MSKKEKALEAAKSRATQYMEGSEENVNKTLEENFENEVKINSPQTEDKLNLYEELIEEDNTDDKDELDSEEFVDEETGEVSEKIKKTKENSLEKFKNKSKNYKEEKDKEIKENNKNEKSELEIRKEKINSLMKTKKNFSLDDYKKKYDIKPLEYKPDSWIPMSDAWRDSIQIPGIPVSRITTIWGHPDVGKSTVALEVTSFAQKVGTLPIFINTEKKFSWDHAKLMGVNKDFLIYVDNLETVEEITTYIKSVLNDQKNGTLPFDILFIWDSVGNVLSDAELKADAKGESAAMMATAKLLNQQIHRIIEKRISDTRKVNFPYNATMLVVNHAYQGTQQNTLIPYGGNGIIKASTISIRMGGVLSSASKCYAIKNGIEMAYAIKTAIVVEKNHITNIAVKNKIICTPQGFIMSTTEALNEYKKNNKDDWELKFDKDWDMYDGD